ncbi:MAG: hypothetical protein H6P95_1293 [Candidatus Aminicenantes bacterium]|nr:hypothetical protein [Candidatus Aminicenantes bacterium]
MNRAEYGKGPVSVGTISSSFSSRRGMKWAGSVRLPSQTTCFWFWGAAGAAVWAGAAAARARTAASAAPPARREVRPARLML